MLTEDEVLQINSITKRRALRYIAAARLPHMGGEVVIGIAVEAGTLSGT
jgi:hypothetical protein